MDQTWDRGRRYVLRHARPLDAARWNHLFEGGSPAAVLDALAAYQNDDGGFGHGVEPDFWNPHSSPMQTWAATEVVLGLGPTAADHPVVRGILAYLASGAAFDGHLWARTIATNNDHPRADWWTHDPAVAPTGYNPTAALAGFALRFATADTDLHRLAKRLATEAAAALLAQTSVEVHELSCFRRLYQGAAAARFDLGAGVERALASHINAAFTRDTSRWRGEYVCRPSRFLRRPDDPLLAGNEALVREECTFLRQTQGDDGSWNVPWSWSLFPNDWPVAKVWWKAAMVTENLEFLRAFEGASR